MGGRWKIKVNQYLFSSLYIYDNPVILMIFFLLVEIGVYLKGYFVIKTGLAYLNYVYIKVNKILYYFSDFLTNLF